MNITRLRAWSVAGAAATLVATGPALAAGQKTDADAQQAREIGRPQTGVPEWQYYDELDSRYGPLAWLTFAEVIGSDIGNNQGEMVGEIIALVRSRSDDNFYTVVNAVDPEVGPDQYVVVPVDDLEVVGDEQSGQIVLASKTPIGDLPAYDEAQYEKVEPTDATQAQQ